MARRVGGRSGLSGREERLLRRARSQGEVVEEVSLAEATRSRYLNYALSVITSRALPDVRDGLKPVQRRILYAMWADLKAGATGRFVKSAAVVGEVMKSYHPHGDQSIYDALVRMAQDFSLRCPLIEGYGNFGSIDGDPPAAMRYTEARLTAAAEELLVELREQTVEFRANYAATTREPVVLPARWPNLLVNGASGIAVGMATTIPPHNLKEVCNALIALLDNPEITIDKLHRHLPGPDFPTGGVVLNSAEDLRGIYANGHGTIKLRGTWEPHPERKEAVVITSIPYGVEKDDLVAKIGELIGKGQVPQLVNIKDLSDEAIRIVLDLRPGANAEAAMAYLYKNTSLQINHHVNMTCLLPALPNQRVGDNADATAVRATLADELEPFDLDESEWDADAAASDPASTTLTAGLDQGEERSASVPERLDLKTMLSHFLDFRMEVVIRKLRHELRQVRRRIHILEGFEIVFNRLDEAIRLIRASNGKADAAPKLATRFGLSALQADAILETKLYRLGKLEIDEILRELAERRARAEELRRLLGDEAARKGLIRDDLKRIAKTYGTPRRTRIEGPAPEVEFREEDYIVDEDAWVIVTRDGWIKRQRSFTDIESIRVRDGDRVGWLFRARARRTLTVLTSRGMAYTTRVHDLVMTTGHGEPISKLFSLEDNERIVGVVCHDPRCLPVHADPADHAAPKRQGVLLATAASGEESSSDNSQPQPPYVVVVTAGGKALRFSLAALAAVSTRKGRAVMRPDPDRPNDEVVAALVSNGHDQVMLATTSARVIRFAVTEIPVVSGPAKGVLAIRLQDETDRVLGVLLTDRAQDTLTVKTSRGGTLELKAGKHPLTSRGGKGTGVLQRGTLVEVLPHPVQPWPSLDQAQTDADAHALTVDHAAHPNGAAASTNGHPRR